MDNKEKFWNRIAKNYDQQVNADDQTAIKTIEHTKKYLRPSDIVMDYACATGKFTFAIGDLVKEIHGIDIASEMIAVAKRIAGERNREHIHFAQKTLFDEGYHAGSFDVILAFNILHLLEDPQQVVVRVNELLKADGIFISATACLGKDRSLVRMILWPLSKLGIVPYINFFRPSEVDELIAHGNFEILETHALSPSPLNYFVAARKLSNQSESLP